MLEKKAVVPLSSWCYSVWLMKNVYIHQPTSHWRHSQQTQCIKLLQTLMKKIDEKINKYEGESQVVVGKNAAKQDYTLLKSWGRGENKTL